MNDPRCKQTGYPTKILRSCLRLQMDISHRLDSANYS